MRFIVVVFVFLASIAEATPRPRFFDVTFAMNSGGTKTIFRQRNRQSGGPTWAGIVRVVLRDMGTIGAPLPPGAMKGVTGEPRAFSYKGVTTWISIDDEGDAVRLWSGSPAVLDAVRAAHRRLNSDASALDNVLARVPADEAE